MIDRRPSWARFDAWMFGPTDVVRVEAFTWLLTWSLMIYTLFWAGEAAEWLTTDGFHPRGRAMLGQQLNWGPLVPGREWFVLGPYLGAMAVVIVRFGRLDVVGRVALALVLVGLVTVSGIDRLAVFTLNKLAIVSVAALICVSTFTDDAPGNRRRVRSAWPVRVLQATLMLQLFGAGVCKLQGDWLAHSDVLWMQAQGVFRTETAAWMMATLPRPAWTLMQWLALGFELLAPVLLAVPRLRPLAFVWGGGMLAMIGLTMAKVGFLTFTVGTYFVLFADPARLGRFAARLRRLTD